MSQHPTNNDLDGQSARADMLLRLTESLVKVGYWELDLESREMTWSDGVYRIAEYEPEEFDLNLQSAINVVHPDDRQMVDEAMNKTIATGIDYSIKKRFITKNGHIKHIRSVAQRVDDTNGKPVKLAGIVHDITDSVDITSVVEIQEQLEKNNELYEYVNLATNNAIYDWDVVSDIFQWGGGFYRMLGYSRSQKPFKLADWAKLEHLEERSKYHDTWVDFLNDPNKTRWTNESRVKRADGMYIHVEEVGHLIRNSEGEPVRMIGVLRDLSTTKELQRLLDSATRLAVVGAWEVDVDAKRLIWSDITKNILEISDYDEPDIATFASFFKEGHSRELQMECFNRAMSNGTPYDMTVQVVTATGREKWIRSIGLPEMEDGKVVRIYGSFQDVTEVKLAQEEILKSNERFNKVAEATNDAIWDFDVSSGQLWWGIGFYTLFGHDPDIIQPSMEKLIMLIHPDDRDRVGYRIQEYMTDGKSTNWYEEYKFRKSNGEYAFVIDRAIFIRDDDGLVIRVVGAMTDITYRKIYEESLLDLNKQLELSNSELEQFAYVASHDLQEPLRMVSSFLNLLEKKYGDVFDDKARQYIHFARDGAVRMRQIILDLLDFSRVGKHSDKKKNVDLNEVMKDVIALHRKQIEEKSARIHVSPMPVLHTFRSPVLQVFQNLVGNALKYVSADRNVVVHVEARELDDWWEFSVADNGIGIDPEDYQRIFIIFQRLHARDEYSGTGMGLAIVKKILDDLGGHIRVESELEKGSTFTFSIPKNQP